MQVEEELAQFTPQQSMVLTIGVFDGVHLGHKYLISQLISAAREKHLLSGVITFRQHPRQVLQHRRRLPLLTTVTQKIELIKKEGVDYVLALTFNPELANLSAREFVRLLQQHLKMQYLLIGPDFTLGKKREGDFEALSTLGQEMGFSVIRVTPKINNGDMVSSTSIRNVLEEGNIEKVNRLLGRPFSIEGKVATGAGRGTGLGFPTANLQVDARQALPPEGVYATWAYVNNEKHQSMTNIGRNPTFGENERTVEVYLLNYEGNLYGQNVKIDIKDRLRNEKRFDSVDDLKKQIADDIRQGIELLNTTGR